MSGTLAKSLTLLPVICALLWRSVAAFSRRRHLYTLLQLLGACFMLVVAFAHIFEGLHFLPWMGWGRNDSPGHYLDLVAALLAAILFPAGFLLHNLSRK